LALSEFVYIAVTVRTAVKYPMTTISLY